MSGSVGGCRVGRAVGGQAGTLRQTDWLSVVRPGNEVMGFGM